MNMDFCQSPSLLHYFQHITNEMERTSYKDLIIEEKILIDNNVNPIQRPYMTTTVT